MVIPNIVIPETCVELELERLKPY